MRSVTVHGVHGDVIFDAIDTFLFDLDGTLIDSLDLHIEAFQWILRKLGQNISKDQLEPLMGKTPQDIIHQFFQHMSREELLEAAGEKEDKLAQIIDTVYVYPGIKQFLNQLQQYQVHSIVISSTHRRLVKILLDKASLLQYLSDIVSGDEVSHGKPDAEPFHKGIVKAGSQGLNVIAVGDSLHDYHSATAAGANFVGILTGKTDRQTFEDAGLSLLIESITAFEFNSH